MSPTARTRKPREKQAMLAQRRPAETGGLAGALALLIGRLLGISDPDVIVAIGILAAAAPAGITWLVTLLRG